MASRAPRIGYIAASLPGLTTTFIYREIASLRHLGFDIVTYGVWKPDIASLSQEARPFVDITTYIFPLAWRKFIVAHLYFLCTDPVRYFRTFYFILSRRHQSFNNRCRSLFHFLEAIYLARDVQRAGVRHMHAHFSIGPTSIALIIARVLDISFSFTAHNIFFTDRLLLKEKLREARFIVSISEYSRAFLLQLLPEEPGLREKMHVVHCGVSPDDFAPPDERGSNQRPLIFSISQLAERKGYPVLVEACRILAQRGCDFECIIAGDGPQRKLLERLIAEYQLEQHVQLAGVVFQEQLAQYLNRASIFVLPCIVTSDGDRDGVPVALMEAMAMQIPPVSTHVSGIPELIEHGSSGLLVEQRDPTALADAMERLLVDDNLRSTLGKNARRTIVRDFDTLQTAMQLGGLFQAYLGSDAPAVTAEEPYVLVRQ